MTQPDAPEDPSRSPSPATRLPGLRLAVLGPALALALAALCAAALLGQFLRERPVNLRMHSDHLTEQVLGILLEQRIPEEAIALSDPEAHHDNQASWRYRTMAVRTPHDLPPERLAAVLARNLEQRYHGGAHLRETGNAHADVLLEGRIMLGIAFESEPPPPPPEPESLAAAAERIATEILEIAIAMGVPPERIEERPPVPRADAEMTWEHYRFSVAWEAGMPDAAALARAAALRMEERPVLVRWIAGSAEDAMTVSMEARELVRVAFEPAEPAPPDEAETAALETSPPDAGPLVQPLLEPLTPEMEELALSPDAPRVAIILDDGGHGGPATEFILGLTSALTLAILPDTPKAVETAERALALGFEIMLHMPMASRLEEVEPYPNELRQDMSPEEIRATAAAALAQTPGAAGVNNHAGSGFTEDAEAMRAFLEFVRDEGLYFVDSYTSAASIAYPLAREMGIPALRRDVFLDHEPGEAALAQAFDRLIAAALEQGSAIGIGHFRKETVLALEEQLARLRAAGIALAPVSELLP